MMDRNDLKDYETEDLLEEIWRRGPQHHQAMLEWPSRELLRAELDRRRVSEMTPCPPPVATEDGLTWVLDAAPHLPPLPEPAPEPEEPPCSCAWCVVDAQRGLTRLADADPGDTGSWLCGEAEGEEEEEPEPEPQPIPVLSFKELAAREQARREREEIPDLQGDDQPRGGRLPSGRRHPAPGRPPGPGNPGVGGTRPDRRPRLN